MKRVLKNSYNYLDLTYKATIDDVKRRETALIKLYNTKAKEKNKSYENKIISVQKAADNIITNIKNNGIPKEEYHRYECNLSSIITLFVVLAFAVGMCVLSFVCF